MFLPAIEHDFCLNPTVTRSLSPFITPNVLASPFFISKSTITAISLIPLRQGRGARRSLLWAGSGGLYRVVLACESLTCGSWHSSLQFDPCPVCQVFVVFVSSGCASLY